MITRTEREAMRIRHSGHLSLVITSATIGNTMNIRMFRGGTYQRSARTPNPFASAAASTAAPATASCTATPTDLKNVISSSDCLPGLSPLTISPISASISANVELRQILPVGAKFGIIRSPASSKQASENQLQCDLRVLLSWYRLPVFLGRMCRRL